MTTHTWNRGEVHTMCEVCLLLPLSPDDWESECDPGEVCPACGNPIDYCQGHGAIGDYHDARILANHDEGRHRDCHSRARCE